MTSTEVQRSLGERQVTIRTRLQGEPQSFSHFGILPAGLTRSQQLFRYLLGYLEFPVPC